MSFKKIVFVLALACPLWAMAQSESCVSNGSYQGLVTCAEQRSPEVLKAEAALKQKRAEREAAGQLQNPELMAESVAGSVDSQDKTETDLALAFPIELGGKRAARKQIADAEISKAELDLYQAKSSARKLMTMNLVRLRQMYEELDLVDESLETFSKLVNQYERRPALSPEQEVTLTVFKATKGEYTLRKMNYDEELGQMESYFKVATGLTLADVKKSLPPKFLKFPTINEGADSVEKSPILSLYRADIDIARGGLEQAKGESWPTVKVGPSVKLFKDGDQNSQLWGVNVSLPIPLLSLNRGGRTAAAAAVQSAEVRRELALKELLAEREALVRSYTKSVSSLKEAPNGHLLEDKHKKVESLFVRGLVPSSLVIEAHRSLVELEKVRNERELKAIESYMSVQLIDGKTVEFSL